jgi:hypothetical protein
MSRRRRRNLQLEMDFRRNSRMEPGSIWFVVGWISLHATALVAAFGTRVAAGSRVESLVQIGFFAAMTSVGAAAWLCQQVEVTWCWSGVTLVLMVLTAVIDFRRISEPARAG